MADLQLLLPADTGDHPMDRTSRLCLPARLLRTTVAAVALGLLALSAAPVRAQLLIDSLDLPDNFAGRIAGSSPLANVTVSAPVAITQIGARVRPTAAGNIKFLIFNGDTGALVFASASQALPNDFQLAYRISAAFGAVTLNPGIHYAIGGISDVDADWSFENANADDVANNITVDGNENYNAGNFGAPVLESFTGAGNISIQLYGGAVIASAAPEPASLALLVLSSLPIVGAVIRRNRVRTRRRSHRSV
jgi:hypothetical protein